MENFVYLIISNYEDRYKVHSVATKDKAQEVFNMLDSGKPENYIKEKVQPFNFKYYALDTEGNKVFKEQLYMEKRPVYGA